MDILSKRALLLLPWLLVSLLTTGVGLGQDVLEYQLKAAFLLNFTKFVEWPPGGISSGSFIIGIFGDDPFGRAIDDVTRGKAVNGYEIRIRRLKEPAEARDCQMVFVASTDTKKNQVLLDSTNSFPILTVGETPEFLNQGGTIRLSMDGNRVGIVINNTAASAKGLKVSAKLLSLAKIYEKSKGD